MQCVSLCISFLLCKNSIKTLHSQASREHGEVMHTRAFGKFTGPSSCSVQTTGLLTLSFRVLLPKAVPESRWWTDSRGTRELLLSLWLVLIKHQTGVSLSHPEPTLPSRGDRGEDTGFCTTSQRATLRETSDQDTQFQFRVRSPWFCGYPDAKISWRLSVHVILT